MLIVTERAGDTLWSIMATAVNPGSAMRLSRRPPPPPAEAGPPPVAIKLNIVQGAEEGDAVVTAPSGVRLFIDQQLAPLLADRVLDSTVDDDGHALLVLDIRESSPGSE